MTDDYTRKRDAAAEAQSNLRTKYDSAPPTVSNPGIYFGFKAGADWGHEQGLAEARAANNDHAVL